MSVARKDDRHNEDLAREIADSFNESVHAKEQSEDGATEPEQRFVITGDQRTPARKRRNR